MRRRRTVQAAKDGGLQILLYVYDVPMEVDRSSCSCIQQTLRSARLTAMLRKNQDIKIMKKQDIIRIFFMLSTQ